MMILKKWEDLPDEMRTEAVRPYYDMLRRKNGILFFKRVFDILVSGILLILLSWLFLLVAIAIKVDSKGPVFFRQVRVTQYGRRFRIFKFRTMVDNAQEMGPQLTKDSDERITRVGRLIRHGHLDEISQLIDVFRGTMTLVGTRPSVEKYVNMYTPEMYATLLLPAGMTSDASVCYRNEGVLLRDAEDVDKVYMEEILPEKMKYNLRSLEELCLLQDVRVLTRTALALAGKKYADDADAVHT